MEMSSRKVFLLVFMILILSTYLYPVAAGYIKVAIVSLNSPSSAGTGDTVSVRLSISYSFPTPSYIEVSIRDSAGNKVWYNSDYQRQRSGQGTLSYTVAFKVPSQPGTYGYKVTVSYWDGNQWVKADEKYFYIQVQQVSSPSGSVEIKIDKFGVIFNNLGSSIQVRILFTLINKDSFTRHVYVCIKGSSIYSGGDRCLSTKEFVLGPKESKKATMEAYIINQPTSMMGSVIIEVRDYYSKLLLSMDSITVPLGCIRLPSNVPSNVALGILSSPEKALTPIVITDSSGCIVGVQRAYKIRLIIDSSNQLKYDELKVSFYKPFGEKLLICTIDAINPIPSDQYSATKKLIEYILKKYAPNLLPAMKAVSALEYLHCITAPDNVLPVKSQAQDILLSGSGELYLLAYKSIGNDKRIVGVSQKVKIEVSDDMPVKNVVLSLHPALTVLVPSTITVSNGQEINLIVKIYNNLPYSNRIYLPSISYPRDALSISLKYPENIETGFVIFSGKSLDIKYILKPLKKGTYYIRISTSGEGLMGEEKVVKVISS
jgi:hypothetical protein